MKFHMHDAVLKHGVRCCKSEALYNIYVIWKLEYTNFLKCSLMM